MNLSPRLKAIAEFVPKDFTLADIGTDHAYLLTYLVQKDIVKYAIGGDVNEGPYLSALRSVKGKGLKDKIDIRHGDGLQVIKPGEVDVVTIAGMGGGTVLDIFTQSLEVVKKLKRLIVQPMIGSELVRKWLYNNEWQIIDEKLAEDDGRIYEIIVAEHLKEENERKAQRTVFKEEIDFLLSPVLIKNKDPLLKKHVTRIIKGNEKILTQLAKSSSPTAIEKQKEVKAIIEKLKVII